MLSERLCAACVLLLALAGHATAGSGVSSTEGSIDASIMATQTPMPDLLEMTAIPEAMKGYWRLVGQYMWNQLLTQDHDYFNALGQVVPHGSPEVSYVASGSNVKCGRFARAWVG
jgi:hypothetical protein